MEAVTFDLPAAVVAGLGDPATLGFAWCDCPEAGVFGPFVPGVGVVELPDPAALGREPDVARFVAPAAAPAGARVELSTAPTGPEAAFGPCDFGVAASVRPAGADVGELARPADPDSEEFVVAADLRTPAPAAGVFVGSEDGAFVVSAPPVAVTASGDVALFGPTTRSAPVAARVLSAVPTRGTPDGVPPAAADGFDPAPDLSAAPLAAAVLLAPLAAAVPVDPCRVDPPAASGRCPAGGCVVAAGAVRSSFPAIRARSVTASAPAASAGRAPSRAGIFSSFGSDTHTPRSRNN
ncbi:hypothetical protein AB0C34_10255 [Nocardia sp. NPDC049220]|uniref:hypothetical protein n=1 Tax=Nocardia sp. NPDC049220 TaxID=3155273 RepID=UPI0033DFE4E1